MGEKSEILNKVYVHLYGIGKVVSKIDFSEKLEVNYTNLTSAFTGSERYLTKNLFKKINEKFDGIFNPDWILTGTGEMLKQSAEPVPIQNSDTRDYKELYMEVLQENIELLKELNEIKTQQLASKKEKTSATVIVKGAKSS